MLTYIKNTKINFLISIFLSIVTICKAEYKVKIYYEPIENGYNIYADNQEFCPVSVKVNFKVVNLTISGGSKKIYILKPQRDRQLLTKLTTSKKGKGYKLSYKCWFNYGDHTKEEFDNDYIYNLPFTTSKSFEVSQGYNGSITHQNINALDFSMPIGTKIAAIREGVVISVVEKNDKNCIKEGCEEYNNFIIIYHPDGTFANYSHITKNGAIVHIGDKVNKGQIIGYSGNVGRSSAPHLHLVVYLQKLNKVKTLETKFKTGNGEINEYLKVKKKYTRDY